MFSKSVVLAAGCIGLVVGCAEPPDETHEIVANLVTAGFPADDIQVIEKKVYAGRDAEVTLAASREMLKPGDTTKEQYRTANIVSPALRKICIDGSKLTGALSRGLDLAIENYNEQQLTFAMARTPSTGCGFTITANVIGNDTKASAGFPSGGLPYPTINLGGGLASVREDAVEHVITHELGHTLGLRHTDYYDRTISCGIEPDVFPNEGPADYGAVHIPGTPTTATLGGSIMNACARASDATGEFTASDITAIRALYTASSLKCSLSASTTSVPPGGSVTFSISLTNAPAGTVGYWYGTKNGAVDFNFVYFGTVPGSYTYNNSPGAEGTYTRQAQIRDAQGNAICMTNSVTVEMKPATPTCSLSVSSTDVPVGGSYTFSVSGNYLPSIAYGYWYGTKNGTTDISGDYLGRIPSSVTYQNQAGWAGSYSRWVVAYDSNGGFVCQTNSVYVKLR